ncbi:MAG: endonuclease III [Firmicutes bacterium]|uniref:Endonuclease III n=1 Tax=Melghirimyces thermohalophilus TaxID=1236220 RepID=A0A1G6RSN2_9BACL|nr:endonuclease III [Melghirimyces thermohalophilus]MDA8353398.1 endonuclease III [Bacillota bacterium]SDD06987.1 DNA-(apurinic or apyrimidinic site) lyase /endonuclease III [Melghirimyces thermohalophilus]
MKEKPKRVPTKKILATLAQMYPDAHCELDFRNPFELLIATILSAQSTDHQVNRVTSKLFAKYPTPEAILQLTEDELAQEIRGLGLYRNKSRNIMATCQILVEKFDGEVPRRRKELEALPGVGRKTANVVLSNAFDVPALAVDTHVQRVSNRLALADSRTPLETERQLTKRVPRKEWTDTHHRLIWHGRRVCVARNPKCHICDLAPYCWYGKNQGQAGPLTKTPSKK